METEISKHKMIYKRFGVGEKERERERGNDASIPVKGNPRGKFSTKRKLKNLKK